MYRLASMTSPLHMHMYTDDEEMNAGLCDSLSELAFEMELDEERPCENTNTVTTIQSYAMIPNRTTLPTMAMRKDLITPSRTACPVDFDSLVVCKPEEETSAESEWWEILTKDLKSENRRQRSGKSGAIEVETVEALKLSSAGSTPPVEYMRFPQVDMLRCEKAN